MLRTREIGADHRLHVVMRVLVTKEAGEHSLSERVLLKQIVAEACSVHLINNQIIN